MWIWSLETSSSEWGRGERGSEHSVSVWGPSVPPPPSSLSHFQLFPCRKLPHHMTTLQSNGLSCVGEADGRGEQSTTVIVPPPFRASFGYLCVHTLSIALQSNSTAVLSLNPLAEFIDLSLGYLFLPNITWPNICVLNLFLIHRTLIYCSPKCK